MCGNLLSKLDALYLYHGYLHVYCVYYLVQLYVLYSLVVQIQYTLVCSLV